MVEMGNETRSLKTVGFEQKMIGGTEDVSIALNAALGVQNKGIVAIALGQRLHRIGDHAVQPSQAVFSGETDAGKVTEIVDSSSMHERSQLRFLIGKDARRNAPEVHLKVRGRRKRSQRRKSCLSDLRRFAHKKIIALQGVPCRAWEGSWK